MSIPLPPLPRLPDGWWKDKVTEAQMESFIHAHAAAVTASKDAEIAVQQDSNAAKADRIDRLGETVVRLQERVRVLEDALSKIDAIRNDVIGRQAIHWSRHIYPLVAALDEAGYPGLDYEAARAALEGKAL